VEGQFDGCHFFSGEVDAGLTLKLLRKITATSLSNDTIESTSMSRILRIPWQMQ
jgi:hypothetical protein